MKTVIFCDLGNVVVKASLDRAYKRLVDFSPYNFQTIKDFTENMLRRKCDKGLISSKKMVQTIIQEFKLNLTEKEFVAIWGDVLAPNPPFEDLLQRLKEKYRLFLVSNIHFLHFRSAKRQFPILKIFDGYTLSYRVKSRKPEEKIFKVALEIAGDPSPKKCVFIDDKVENVIAAINLGMTGLLYDYNKHGEFEKALEFLGIIGSSKQESS